MDDDVLKFVLRGHLLDCYEWIYFPYMLEAIAHQIRDPLTDEFVLKGLQMSVERIRKNRKGFKHRHHGVWLMLRSCTRSALVILAASRRRETEELLPLAWKDAVMGAVEMLTYWQDEAEDARDRLRSWLRSGILRGCRVRLELGFECCSLRGIVMTTVATIVFERVMPTSIYL
jgi:hypothetical protein